MYLESTEPVRSADAQKGNKDVVGGHGIICKARQLLLCHLEFRMSSGSSRNTGDGKHSLELRADSCNASSSKVLHLQLQDS